MSGLAARQDSPPLGLVCDVDDVVLSSFLAELEKLSASKGRLAIPKSRSGRRPISVSKMLEKDKANTLFKKQSNDNGVQYKSVGAMRADLEPGDILLTRALHPTLMSRAVSAVQGSEYGHSSLYAGGDKVIDTRIGGVVETSLAEVHSKWGDGRNIRAYRPRATDDQKEEAVSIARSYVGTPYDKLTALRLVLPAAHNDGGKLQPKKDSIICSQLIVQSYPTLNFASKKYRGHVLPVDISNSPLTKRVGELSIDKHAEEEHKLQGHMSFQGIPIAIENRKGSVRKGTDPDGKPWKTLFKLPYGFIKKTEGNDGEEIDVYVGPDKSAPNAFVVHQRKLDGTGHDEDKVFVGMKSEAATRKAYLDHYNKVGPKLLGPISTITIDALKQKLDDSRKHTKLSAIQINSVSPVGTSNDYSGGAPGRRTDKFPTAEGVKAAEVDTGNTTLYGDKGAPQPPRKQGDVPDRDAASSNNKLAWDGVGSGGSLGSGSQASLFTGDKPDRAKQGDVPSRDGSDVTGVKVKHEAGPDYVATVPTGGAQMSSETGAMSR